MAEEGEQKRGIYRSSKVATRVIELTHDDPIDRLKQFCNQGMYKYKFTWDKFSNGIMCELEVTYQLNPSTRRTLWKEARYTDGTDVHQAQEVVAAILLDKLGLGVPAEEQPEEIDETEAKMREIADKGLAFAVTAFDKAMSGAMFGNDPPKL